MSEALSNPPSSDEYNLVVRALGVEPLAMSPEAHALVETCVQVAASFSRVNPRTGHKDMISPSRVELIPLITARRQEQVYAARGELTRDQIIEEWRGNTPQDHGRHPDRLFDMARMNFGHDGPVGQVERSVMQRELELRELRDRYARHIARTLERMESADGTDY